MAFCEDFNNPSISQKNNSRAKTKKQKHIAWKSLHQVVCTRQFFITKTCIKCLNTHWIKSASSNRIWENLQSSSISHGALYDELVMKYWIYEPYSNDWFICSVNTRKMHCNSVKSHDWWNEQRLKKLQICRKMELNFILYV